MDEIRQALISGLNVILLHGIDPFATTPTQVRRYAGGVQYSTLITLCNNSKRVLSVDVYKLVV